MPARPSADLRRAAVLGAVSGLRTFTAPAVLAVRGRWGGGPVARILALAALGEVLADKSAVIPSRGDAPSLFGRMSSGAASGAAVGGPRGAGAGAAGAAATTYASERLRARLGETSGLPDVALGMAEDAVAAGIAIWVTRSLADRPGQSEPEPELRPEPEPEPAGSTDGARAQSRETAATSGQATPLLAVTRGLAAAAVGTAAMTSVQTAYLRLTGAEASEVPAEMGERIVRGVLRRRVPRRRRAALNQATHAAYGTSWGLPLGLLAGSLRRTPPASALSLGIGLGVWGASLAALPALKLAPPPWHQSPGALAVDLTMHLVYGAAAGATYVALAEST